MPFGIMQSPSLGIRPGLPVWIRWADGVPRILVGGVLVVPFNTALRYRARHDGATRKSLAAYARAGALYTTYCAHQRVGRLDVANDEFPTFVDGLLGLKFRDASGECAIGRETGVAAQERNAHGLRDDRAEGRAGRHTLAIALAEVDLARSAELDVTRPHVRRA